MTQNHIERISFCLLCLDFRVGLGVVSHVIDALYRAAQFPPDDRTNTGGVCCVIDVCLFGHFQNRLSAPLMIHTYIHAMISVVVVVSSQWECSIDKMRYRFSNAPCSNKDNKEDSENLLRIILLGI